MNNISIFLEIFSFHSVYIFQAIFHLKFIFVWEEATEYYFKIQEFQIPTFEKKIFFLK